MIKVFLVLVAALIIANAKFAQIYKDYGVYLTSPVGADVGDPLILTTYIEQGKIQEGQQAALVHFSDFQGIESYSGYFTVDSQYSSNLFFWFFPSADNAAEDPVVLWLNGGPGATSMNGLFDENGPFKVEPHGEVMLREYSWHRNQSLLFFDQPAGTGFSYTNGGFATNETKVGADMYSALYQFFQLFPNLQQNEFYISGESYAGKYLPAIGHTILHSNPSAELKINLQGILIGDGWSDPVHQSNYGPLVYNVGLVNAEVRDEINQHNEMCDLTAEYHSLKQTALIVENSGANLYNYLIDYNSTAPWINFLGSERVRKAIHVGNTEFGDKGARLALNKDIMKSIASWVEELLENYPVLIYTGQVDIIVGYPMTLEYLRTLNFSGAAEYNTATRKIWYVDDAIAGYVRIGGNLTELLVRNAGHLVPMDQPKWAYDMLYRFTRNLPYA